ncbi:MAG: peptide chain release factor 1 [Cyanobacteria bacterium]|nr:peptide chain release factor 1 [Cyanobacteriota bacterium]
MRDPLWRLKTLPWLVLLQAAALTVVAASLLDLLLAIALLNLPQPPTFLNGISGLLLVLLAAGGIGVLAVTVMETIFARVLLNQGVLWALLVCVALFLWLRQWVPVPAVLVGLSYYQFVGMMVGLFSKGRRYWRY